MVRGWLAVLLPAGQPLTVACSSDPTCDDVGSLQQRLDDMDPDDPDFNGVNGGLLQAQVACNAG